ncbi:hypothetical protein QO012_001320 [Methylobacterium aerolatum]|uniref:Uncharacterized protein n=1 Tax=Methylobacterium aerolatum TaxID=418708 RepID=A0ABU0HWW2_9HYPH|nr:hypothetical protein [Methylobacterium aerolatum]GJD33794.1 hypothetical protein FMGBMHLM_0687 [Methylobacterium aerolatum]
MNERHRSEFESALERTGYVLDAEVCLRREDGANLVRNHGAVLYRKIGVHKRSDAVIWGRENAFSLHVQRTT